MRLDSGTGVSPVISPEIHAQDARATIKAPQESRLRLATNRTTIVVRACKYDGSEHRRWPAQLLKQEGSLIVLDAKFPTEVTHESLGTIAAGTHSLEYYWLDRWYNIFRFAQPNGSLRNYYFNINMPPTFDGDTLSYVDLDMDILLEPDFSYQLLDVEEFEKNAMRYSYPLDVQANARQAVDELISMIEMRALPFSVEAG